jgi:anaerobic C4-dicarboxylate transporter
VQPRYSLLQAHGAVVLLPSAVPLLVAVLVTAALYAAQGRGRSWPLPLAWALSVALLAAALVGFVTFLIGVFVVPTGVLLVAATSLAHRAGRTAPR